MRRTADIRSSQILGMSTLAFAACFALWTIFSVIGIGIKGELGLNETKFGLLIATPILTGSLFRMPLGIWSDRYGGRPVLVTVMLASAIATLLLPLAHTFPLMLLAGLGVGMAGSSFAIGVSYVSRWYPKEKQGTALGIFGVGNVGAAVTTSLAPFVMAAFGWPAVAQVWATALAVMAVIFWFTTADDPVRRARRAQGLPAVTLRQQLARLLSMPRSGDFRSIISSSSAVSLPWLCGCPASTSAPTIWT
jgi:NNP family nitrate/nitrite transporter-like MFS transporter